MEIAKVLLVFVALAYIIVNVVLVVNAMRMEENYDAMEADYKRMEASYNMIVNEYPRIMKHDKVTNGFATGHDQGYYCVVYAGREQQDVSRTDVHEQCHHLIYNDKKHFCE